jgi:hypothetical protein
MCTGNNMVLEVGSTVSSSTRRIFKTTASIRAFRGDVAAQKNLSWKHDGFKERDGMHQEIITDVLAPAERSAYLQHREANSLHGISTGHDKFDVLPGMQMLTKATDGLGCSSGDETNCVPDECDCQLPVSNLNPTSCPACRAWNNGDEHDSMSSRPCDHHRTETVNQRCNMEINQAATRESGTCFCNALPDLQTRSADASTRGGDNDGNGNHDGNQDNMRSNYSTSALRVTTRLLGHCEDDKSITSRSAFGKQDNQGGTTEQRPASGDINAETGSTASEINEMKEILLDIKKRMESLLNECDEIGIAKT